MKLLVFGQSGQVATELQRLTAGLPHPVTFLGRDTADLSQPADCAAMILSHKPDAVINAAAYTAVDKAEEEEELALTVNAKAPHAMAQTCANLNIPFVHISTDYVFDGNGDTARTAEEQTNPINAYGRTKLAGEEAIRATGARHVILRTSWVFSAHGNNFVKTMLRLSETRDALTIVADQTGGPTSARAIAEACLELAKALHGGAKGGTYHFSGAPDVSWADFAQEIFAQAGRNVQVKGIPTTEYPTPAQRPLNSRLDCASLETDFGITRPDWKADLAKVLSELI